MKCYMENLTCLLKPCFCSKTKVSYIDIGRLDIWENMLIMNIHIALSNISLS